MTQRPTETSIYVQLIEGFLDGRLSASSFKTGFFRIFKDDPGSHVQAEYDILNKLFGDLDNFYADPSLRDPGDLDEKQLRAESKKALTALKAIQQTAA